MEATDNSTNSYGNGLNEKGSKSETINLWFTHSQTVEYNCCPRTFHIKCEWVRVIGEATNEMFFSRMKVDESSRTTLRWLFIILTHSDLYNLHDASEWASGIRRLKCAQNGMYVSFKRDFNNKQYPSPTL